jgi:pyruvate dehydrogenase E1 component alpha subunit
MGKIAGFCHLYIGQEAVAVGVTHCLRPTDQQITSYRDHGHLLAVGADPVVVLAELLGRAGGCSKGKGGSMHMFDLPRGFYGGHGIVGAQVSLGTGMAFASRYRGRDDVVVAYLGDGAVNQGQVYESFNMAALWKLPVIYIIENNEYAMGTSVARSCAMPDLFRKGESFGIPGVQVDGMDIEAVVDAMPSIIEHVRSGRGPMVVEMKTYRFRGHSMSDPAKYRTKEEVEHYRGELDPLVRLRQSMERAGVSAEWFEQEEDRLRADLKRVIEEAEAMPEPDASALWTDITLKEEGING